MLELTLQPLLTVVFPVQLVLIHRVKLHCAPCARLASLALCQARQPIHSHAGTAIQDLFQRLDHQHVFVLQAHSPPVLECAALHVRLGLILQLERHTASNVLQDGMVNHVDQPSVLPVQQVGFLAVLVQVHRTRVVNVLYLPLHLLVQVHALTVNEDVTQRV